VSDELEQRIAMLIKQSKGTMPVGLLASSKEEAEEALRILAMKRGGKIVTVYVRKDGYDIQFKPDSPAQPG
jgi:hypothetical protein